MKGLTGNNPANDPDKKPMKAYSHFKPNMSLYYTALFGMCTPTYAAQIVPDDRNFSIRSNHDFDTANIKAPVMTPLKFHKDNFLVPLRAILPNTADLVVTNPLQGDDVVFPDVQPALDVKLLLKQLHSHVYYLRFPIQNTGSHTYTAAQVLSAVSQLYMIAKFWLSRDSLLNRLGISLCSAFIGPCRIRDGKYLSIDEVLEHCINIVKANIDTFEAEIAIPKFVNGSITQTTTTIKVSTTQEVSTFFGASSTPTKVMCLRDYLELLWSYPVYRVKNVIIKTGSNWDVDWPYIPEINGTETLNSYLDFDILQVDFADADKYRNISRLIAYQLACAAFFTNDGVDAIYNASLYHQNQLALVLKGSHSFQDRFTYNGVGVMYDSCAGTFINQIINYTGLAIFDTTSLSTPGSTNPYVCYGVADGAYFMNIFSPQRSLKFRDYFVGSKVRPLAVGNVDVTVNSNLVNVVDVTKNIMKQKFLNQVNRLGRSLKEYSQGIFGISPMPTPTEPIYLGGTTDMVGAEETDNTGEDMLTQDYTVRTKFRSNASRFMFQLDRVQEFSYIITIVHFEVARPYVDVTDRETYAIDRYDMFNPYMQQIGDQPVHNSEIVPCRMLDATSAKENFGYQLRYAEYKQRVDRAVGGFVDFLPGFAFLNDETAQLPLVIDKPHMGSDFLRAKPREFDQFFNSLVNYSPAGYFHFIIRDDFEVNADRPMLSAPTIL